MGSLLAFLRGSKRPRRRVRRAVAARAQRLTLPKGLTHAQAYRAASRRAVRDFRGMTYNPKTGRTVLT